MDTLRITPIELSFYFSILIALFSSAYTQNDIEVQDSGTVKVKQGDSVVLWCKLKYDADKVVPVNWQSPPNFKTRTSNCEAFVKDKYVMSCSETWQPFGFYNMTIKDVQWADHGEYRCLYTRHKGIVNLEVLVPVTNVKLSHVSNSTEDPPFLSKGTNAVLTCKTNCAYPAAKISWLENGQPLNTAVNSTRSECTGDETGQMRSISTITVMGKYVDKDKKVSNISCRAENDISGLPGVPSSPLKIYYDVSPSTPQPLIMAQGSIIVIAVVVVGAVVFLIVIIPITVFVVRKKRQRVLVERNQEEENMRVVEHVPEENQPPENTEVNMPINPDEHPPTQVEDSTSAGNISF